MFRIKPKEDRFFQQFSLSTDFVCKATLLLQKIMNNPQDLEEKIKQLQQIEHAADDVTSSIIDGLNRSLITPIDREDIFTLAQSLDHIIDFVLGSAYRMLLYKVNEPLPAASELARLLAECANNIHTSFKLLTNLSGNRDKIIAISGQIVQLESEGDRVYRLELARLFEHEQNPVVIIKLKDILERLETALDYCEDVADLLKGVVLKHA